MLNGISGLEHLSNSLAVNRDSPTSKHLAMHSADMIKPQYNSAAPTASPGDLVAQSESPGSGANKRRLQVADSEYDPFFANEQRYLEWQKAQVARQSQIYSRHMADVTLAKQREEDKAEAEARRREEQRRDAIRLQLN